MEPTPPNHGRAREVVQTAAEAGLNLVPIVGGTLAVVMVAALNRNLIARREEWFTELAERLQSLSERIDDLSLDDLSQNDDFVDAVVQATRVLEHSSQRDKIQALRNAVLNAAMPAPPERDVQGLFFNLLDSLTPTHLRLLDLLNDPGVWFERSAQERPDFNLSSSRRALIDAALPELALQGGEVTDRFYIDLTSSGLVNSGGLNTMMSADGAWQPVTTSFGQRFMAFLTEPGDD
jgi:hypothetical protein